MIKVNSKNGERKVEQEVHTLSVFAYNVSELAICSQI